jgi:hypothetical protein
MLTYAIRLFIESEDAAVLVSHTAEEVEKGSKGGEVTLSWGGASDVAVGDVSYSADVNSPSADANTGGRPPNADANSGGRPLTRTGRALTRTQGAGADANSPSADANSGGQRPAMARTERTDTHRY